MTDVIIENGGEKSVAIGRDSAPLEGKPGKVESRGRANSTAMSEKKVSTSTGHPRSIFRKKVKGSAISDEQRAQVLVAGEKYRPHGFGARGDEATY